MEESQSEESQNEEPQNEEPQIEESQTEESQTEEPQNEESQTEESQTEESQNEEPQNEESQTEESQTEESQTEQSQPEESQPEESQPEEYQRKYISKEKWEEVFKDVDIRKEDMNKVVMNFLVTECYEEAVEKFITESGTKHTDLEKMQARADIRRKILCWDIDAINAFIVSSYRLQPLYFHRINFWLILQAIIERIRVGSVEDAVTFGQEQLSLYDNTLHPFYQEEIEKVFCLVAFKDLSICPFKELLEDSQRLETANRVSQTILDSEGQGPEPMLYSILREMRLVQHQINQINAYPQMDIFTGILEDAVF